MKLTIRPASPQALEAIVSARYGPPYEFYDGDGEPVLNPERYYEALDEQGSFVGHFYFEEKEGAVEIGLGLRPELTGQGLGLDFVIAGVKFARRRWSSRRIVLSVAAFNERAIKVYERAGFRETGRHVRSFERWGDVEFVDMEERR